MKINKLQLNEFAKKFAIEFIVLFGSQANKNAKKESDFDIAVMLNSKKKIRSDFKIYSEILQGLGELLKLDSLKIDLTDLNSANILLRYEITSKGKLLFGDEDKYNNFRAFAFRDYIDAKPLFKLETRLVIEKNKLIQNLIKK